MQKEHHLKGVSGEKIWILRISKVKYTSWSNCRCSRQRQGKSNPRRRASPAMSSCLASNYSMFCSSRKEWLLESTAEVFSTHKIVQAKEDICSLLNRTMNKCISEVMQNTWKAAHRQTSGISEQREVRGGETLRSIHRKGVNSKLWLILNVREESSGNCEN